MAHACPACGRAVSPLEMTLPFDVRRWRCRYRRARFAFPGGLGALISLHAFRLAAFASFVPLAARAGQLNLGSIAIAFAALFGLETITIVALARGRSWRLAVTR